MKSNFSLAITKSIVKIFLAWWHFLLLGGAIVFILENMLQSGMYPTHDTDYHIIRALHFYNELNRGQFPVRMASDLAYYFGYPVFQFFYPLPYYVTAIFQFSGFDAVTSWKLMQATVTILSVAACYAWLRNHYSTLAATVGTLVYTLVPFRLLTLYVTGQIGGTFSLLWAPLIFLGIHKVTNDHKHIWGGISIAVGIAGLITSHIISVIIFFIPLAGYALWQVYVQKSWIEPLLALTRWTTLGLGISAFYLVPFLLEKHWVVMGHKIMVNHDDHWPTIQQLLYSPWGYGHSEIGTNDGMSFQLGLAIILAFVVTLLIIVTKKSKGYRLAILMSAIFVLLVFLMTAASAPIWEFIVPLQLMQFQWRMLAATSLVGAFLAAWSINTVSNYPKIILAILLVGLAFYNSRNYTRAWPLDWKQDAHYTQDRKTILSSADVGWELMPVNVTWIYSDEVDVVLNAEQEGIIIDSFSRPSYGSTRLIADITATQSSQAKLAIWHLPVWRVDLNGSDVQATVADDGTISVPIEEGQTRIEVSLQRTLVQQISDVISTFSLAVLSFVMIFKTNLRQQLTKLKLFNNSSS